MFNSLSGTLTYKGIDNIYLLNSCGIEWDITVSAKTLSALPPVGDECQVYTYYLHTENMVKLYGFFTKDERTFFLELNKVNGIGPKQAMKMLSSISAKQMAEALDKDDVALLAGIPGVGKKTAQKLMLAMRGKLVMDEELIAAPAGNPKFADIVNALSDMGFEYKKALKAVEEVAKNSDIMNMKEDEREKEIFKRAIVLLST
ncbi:MAG: Holliday junction branch migration protein RuvA [Spirochaetia bacterium]|nr:Holliday junction branch migration protein RuvA [Spirochaetia bacterium]MBR4437140.1 Holliday junction branch migration protein RuvA [Spirochaetales bacterium]MBR4797589.1 Holliday junction branch migration protein RuvA [Spirochaetia bacterium]MBR5017751.1 Holliday junction branch migration protein RuvA [Spirochaetia bacterium]MBR5928035.1 Holliday junction branch migration protein RuvA [Spirochaetia bacterium]